MPGRTDNYKYRQKKYEYLQVNFPKGKKSAVQAAAKAKGFSSMNAYIMTLIEKDAGIEGLVLTGNLPTEK